MRRCALVLFLALHCCTGTALASDALDRKVDVRFDEAVTIERAYELLGALGGKRFVFDEGVRIDERVKPDLRGLTLAQSLELLDTVAGLARAPLVDGVDIVHPDNQTKRREYEQQGVRTFYLQHSHVKDVNALLRGVVDVRKTAVNETLNSITIRDNVAKLALAADLIDDMDVERAMVDFTAELWLLTPKAAEALHRRSEGKAVLDASSLEGLRRRSGVTVLGSQALSALDGDRLAMRIQDRDDLSLNMQAEARTHSESRELTVDLSVDLSVGPLENRSRRVSEMELRMSDGDGAVFGGLLRVQPGSKEHSPVDLLDTGRDEAPHLAVVLTASVSRWPAFSEKNTSLREIGTDRRLRYPQD